MEYEIVDPLKISKIGIGTYSLWSVYGKKDSDLFEKVLLKAYEEGIAFFDTSDSYGHGEDFLGRF